MTKSAFPMSYVSGDDGVCDIVEYGITYDEYLAARIYPVFINMSTEYSWDEQFEYAADLTLKAIDALKRAQAERAKYPDEDPIEQDIQEYEEERNK